ncbi:MAG: hypothetical protein JO135_09085 [Candidatus Eremiobacteraeota bacterium]|nr:hypothetical protein [Candidatus Eremiobacteraeota bacterium]
MWWALGGALLLLAPFLLRNGIPAYIHDWSWPPDQAGLRAMTARAAAAWLQDGLGTPNVFPSALPQFYFEWLLAWILPSKAVLDLLLVVTFAFGIAGGAFAARTLLEISGRWAVACGFFYMAGPVAVAKFVAGHTSYLQGYATLPLVLALALSSDAQNRRRHVILTGIALAFSIVQLQIFGLAILILIVAVIVRRRTPADAILIVLVALPIILPAILGATVLAQPAQGALSMQRAVLSWQFQQSVSPLEAFEARGYFVHYYELLTQFWLQHVLLLFPLCALLALIGMRRPIRLGAVVLILLALVAWLTATGLRGPLHAFWTIVFTQISALSVYRELYDVMALYWLACVLLAVRFWMTQPAVGWLFALFGLWSTVPAWFAAPNVFGWAPESRTIAMLERAAKNLPSGRILWWPAQQPIGPANRAVGGADPLAHTPLAQEHPIFEYQPYGGFAAALTLAQAGQWPGAERILRQLSVAAIGDRRGLASFVSGRAQSALAIPASQSTKLLVRNDDVDLFAIADPLPILTLQRLATFSQVAHSLPRSLSENTPGRGRLVAAYPYYYAAASIGFCGQASVLGFPTDLKALQHPWYFVAPFPSNRSCRWISRDALDHLSDDALLVAGGWSEHPLPAPTSAHVVRSGSVEITSESSDAIEGQATGGGVLVFRSEFDPRWTLIANGTRTSARLVEGFANGWPLPAGASHFRIAFAPSPYIRIAVTVGLLWLLVLLGDLVRILWNERRSAAAH